MVNAVSNGGSKGTAQSVDIDRIDHNKQSQHKNSLSGTADHTDTHYVPNNQYMNHTPPVQAFINVNAFLVIWFTGALFIPISFTLSVLQLTYIPIYILLLYYLLHTLKPLHYWRKFHRFNIAIESKYKYFAEQKLILHSKAEQSIQRDSKKLLCWHPHGVVCMGWSMNGNSKQYFMDKRFNWLSADSLFMLPFIRDYLSYCGGVCTVLY